MENNICILISFLEWKKKQRKETRGGKIMYDVKYHYKWLSGEEMFDHWESLRK